MKDLTKGNPGKLIVQFAIPIFIGNIFQLFYSLVDTRIVGSTLGNEALAAVGATSTINNLIIGFLIGLTNGFAIWVARDFGAKNEAAMRKDIAGTLKIGIMISIFLTIFSVVFLKSILRILNMPEELMESGMAYIRVILLGMSMAMLYNVCASVLRAIGDTFTPLCFLVFSTIVNIGLDYFFILGLHTGVEGAAYATVISQALSAIMCFIYIWKRYPILHLSKEDFAKDQKLTKVLLASGLSMGLMQSLVSLGTVALQGAINTFGTNTIVAHAGARKITEMFMLPFSVLGMTMATYCSQNLGAGKIGRIKKGLKQSILMAWTWCIVVVLASYTIAPALIRVVTATQIEEVVNTASLYLRVDTLLYFVTALISILRNSLQGLGDRMTPIYSSSIELVGKVMVVLFLTPKLHYMGIILAEPIVWVLMVIPLIVRILTLPVLKEEKIEKQFKTLLFDLDGTLIDPKEGITKSVAYALKTFGIEENPEQLTSFIGPPLKESFMVKYNLTEEQANQAIEAYREYFRSKGIFEDDLYDGIGEMLKALKEAGKSLAVATSKPTIFAKQILERHQIASYFDWIMGSELDGTRTKKSEVIEEVLKQAQLATGASEGCLMIGDRKHDIEGAKTLEIVSLGVEYGYAELGELEAAGANYIVKDVEALKNFLMAH